MVPVLSQRQLWISDKLHWYKQTYLKELFFLLQSLGHPMLL